MPITTVGTTLQSCSLQGVTMTKKFLTATALTCALAAPTAASAATFEARSLECEGQPGCFLLIIDGRIELNDDQKFEKLVKDNGVKMAVVGLNSPGGNLVAGIAIGRSIHSKGYGTYVPGWATCASSCADIWLAGSSRQVEAKSRVGFHAAYVVDKKGRADASSNFNASVNAVTGAYYASLGLSDMTIVYMTSTGPKDIRWLNMVDAKKYDIDVVMRKSENDMFFVGPWPKEKEAVVAPVEPREPTYAAPTPSPVTTSDSARYCVTIVPAPQEVQDDPEFDPVGWLTVREKPSQESKAVTTTGAVGKTEADATDGEWTHLTGRGWVRTKYVQPCDGKA
jgi:hypothetical protein